MSGASGQLTSALIGSRYVASLMRQSSSRGHTRAVRTKECVIDTRRSLMRQALCVALRLLIRLGLRRSGNMSLKRTAFILRASCCVIYRTQSRKQFEIWRLSSPYYDVSFPFSRFKGLLKYLHTSTRKWFCISWNSHNACCVWIFMTQIA